MPSATGSDGSVKRVVLDIGNFSPLAVITRFRQTLGEIPKRTFQRIKAMQDGDLFNDSLLRLFGALTKEGYERSKLRDDRAS